MTTKRSGQRKRKSVVVKADGPIEVLRPRALRVLNVAERTFARLEAEGVIVASVKGRGRRPSRYDLETLVPAYLEHVTGQKPMSDREARSRKDLSQAELNELRLARERGELLPREDVILAGQNYTKAWAAMVQSLPRQLIHAGVIQQDQESKVASLCRDILLEISSWKVLGDTDASLESRAS